MISWLFLLVATIIVFVYYNRILGFSLLLFTIYKILNDSGVLVKITFEFLLIQKSRFYYSRYQGNYRNIHPKFKALNKICNKFKNTKSGYSLCGIYYDNPDKIEDINKSTAVVGFLFPEAYSNDTDLEAYLKENRGEFSYSELPSAKCIYTQFPFNSIVSMIVAIYRYYKELKKQKESKFFKECEVDDNNCIIEVYNNYIQFLIPLSNKNGFSLYK